MMEMKFIKLLLLLIAVFANEAFAADWYYAGGSKNGKGKSEYQFIDRNTETKVGGTVVRFWVESIPEISINRYKEKHNKEWVNNVAKKLVDGYIPDVLFLERYKKMYTSTDEQKNAQMSILSLEVAANSGVVPETAKFYFEIDCQGKRIHYINAYVKNDSGIMVAGGGKHESDWSYISPDSNSDDWALMLCRAQ